MPSPLLMATLSSEASFTTGQKKTVSFLLHSVVRSFFNNRSQDFLLPKAFLLIQTPNTRERSGRLVGGVCVMDINEGEKVVHCAGMASDCKYKIPK